MYLSIYGISTNKFNNLVSEKIIERDKNLKIGFDKIKIFLNFNNRNFELKLITRKFLLKIKKS